jgi:hypothetical protein
MKPVNTPVAIRLEFVAFDEPSPRASSGAARAARSLLRRRLEGAKRIEAVLRPEFARALTALQQRSGSTYSSIIEEALLAASKW